MTFEEALAIVYDLAVHDHAGRPSGNLLSDDDAPDPEWSRQAEALALIKVETDRLATMRAQKPVPVFGLNKGSGESIPLEAFAPMTDEEAAEWSL